MDIKTTKIELVKTILAIENNEFIQRVADFINKENVDFWDDLSNLKQEEIKLGIKQLDQGKRISFESVMNKIS